jgi:hypothetical protein
MFGWLHQAPGHTVLFVYTQGGVPHLIALYQRQGGRNGPGTELRQRPTAVARLGVKQILRRDGNRPLAGTGCALRRRRRTHQNGLRDAG